MSLKYMLTSSAQWNKSTSINNMCIIVTNAPIRCIRECVSMNQVSDLIKMVISIGGVQLKTGSLKAEENQC